MIPIELIVKLLLTAHSFPFRDNYDMVEDGAGFTVAKLIKAKEILYQNGADVDFQHVILSREAFDELQENLQYVRSRKNKLPANFTSGVLLGFEIHTLFNDIYLIRPDKQYRNIAFSESAFEVYAERLVVTRRTHVIYIDTLEEKFHERPPSTGAERYY